MLMMKHDLRNKCLFWRTHAIPFSLTSGKTFLVKLKFQIRAFVLIPRQRLTRRGKRKSALEVFGNTGSQKRHMTDWLSLLPSLITPCVVDNVSLLNRGNTLRLRRFMKLLLISNFLDPILSLGANDSSLCLQMKQCKVLEPSVSY